MISHMLNSAFIDSIESDLETLRAINRLAAAISDEQRAALGVEDLREVEFLFITPSIGINTLAEEHLHELPRSVRAFLRLTGATARGGGTSSASYLLFEPGFIGRLIDLGYEDTLKQESRVRQFFNVVGRSDSDS